MVVMRKIDLIIFKNIKTNSEGIKKIIAFPICMGIFWVIFSCHSEPQNKVRENFDISLLTESSELQLSGQYEAFVRLNKEYLRKAAKMRYTGGKGLCYLNMAGVNVSAGNYEKARYFFNKAEKGLFNSENTYHKAVFYDDYSLYYSHLKLNDRAIECNNKAFYYLKQAKKTKLTQKLLPRLYVNKGIYYAWKGWFGTSLKCFRKANMLENSAYTNCMVAQYYLFTHKPDSAGIYIARADEKMISQKTTDVESLWVYYTMGYYYNEIDNSEQAEKALKKALRSTLRQDEPILPISKKSTKHLQNYIRKKMMVVRPIFI